MVIRELNVALPLPWCRIRCLGKFGIGLRFVAYRLSLPTLGALLSSLSCHSGMHSCLICHVPDLSLVLEGEFAVPEMSLIWEGWSPLHRNGHSLTLLFFIGINVLQNAEGLLCF